MSRLIPIPLEISHADPEAYLLPHLGRTLLRKVPGENILRPDRKEKREVARAYLERLPYVSPELSAFDDPGPDDALSAALDTRASRLSETVDHTFPLFEGEAIESERLFFLASSRDDLPKGCLALERITNFSTCLFVDPGSRYCADSKELTSGHTLPEPSASGDSEVDFAEVARRVATLLAKKIGGRIGSMILEQVWPSGNSLEQQWDRAFEQIRLIVKRALAAEAITEATDHARGFLDFHANEYVHLRDDPEVSKDELLAALAPYSHDFYSRVVSRLAPKIGDDTSRERAVSAFANFLLGANLHLALLQERARLTGRQAEIETIRTTARRRARYATNMDREIVSYRLSFFTEIESSCGLLGSYYSFVDRFEGKESARVYFDGDNFMERLELARRLRREAMNEAAQLKRRAFRNNVRPVIDSWLELAENPMPASR